MHRGSAVRPVGNYQETRRARNAPHTPARAKYGVWVRGLISVSIATWQQISSRLGERSELGIEAKVCELSDEALGPHVLGAAIEMVGTKILKLRAVLEHVVDGREQ
jgi:hypothetical protein